jgi:FtsH-binding integral membrane protein
MNQYPRQMSPSQLGVRPTVQLSAGFLSQSFLWMFAGLLITAVTAYLVQSNPSLVDLAASLYLPLIIGQFILVIAISAAITRISATVALLLFFVYSATMGVTLSFIFIAYDFGSVSAAFLSASAMFGAAALYGAVTKRSLASMGGFLFMALIGIVIASFLNLFIFHSATVNLGISILGVLVFVGLTAWNVQKISRGDYAAATGSMEKGAVIAALALYLDFINIFLFLLRIFGNRS